MISLVPEPRASGAIYPVKRPLRNNPIGGRKKRIQIIFTDLRSVIASIKPIWKITVTSPTRKPIRLDNANHFRILIAVSLFSINQNFKCSFSEVLILLITVSSNYTTDIGGNPFGGLKQTIKYSSFVDIAVALDFEKIASIKGMALTVGNYIASGGDLSGAIGNFFGPQEIYTA